MTLLWLALRSAIFYIGYVSVTALFTLGFPILFLMPYGIQWRTINCWNHFVVVWLRLVCGVRYTMVGVEHIPVERPIVVLSKHQSQWETFFLQTQFGPASTILKQELLNIPGFGWGLRFMKPIAIDRDNPREALRQILERGRHRIDEGNSILVFPEGTRTDPGEKKRYARSGAELAINSNLKVLPVAHNAGYCWPARRFLKYPGVITVSIGSPIDASGMSSRALTDQVEAWIESEVEQLGDGRNTVT